ncbi:hypothetical protein IV59_GL000267 [Paucilactobacillus hokkaidonensis]|nr:hypothetical protein IV59_GL000267 [Paucilactobacillus hokkaidonensis]
MGGIIMAGLNFTTNVDVHNKQDFQRLQQLITPKKDAFTQGEGKKEIDRIRTVFKDIPFTIK